MDSRTQMKVLYTAYRNALKRGDKAAAETLFVRFVQVAYDRMPR